MNNQLKSALRWILLCLSLVAVLALLQPAQLTARAAAVAPQPGKTAADNADARARVRAAVMPKPAPPPAPGGAEKSRPVQGTGPPDDPTRQTESDWVDDRWSKTDIGQFLCATIDIPRRRTFKGIAIKVGDQDEGTVCFDTELLQCSAGWTGGFLELSPTRYGLMNAPKPRGEVQFTTTAAPGWARRGSFDDPRERHLGPLPRDWARHGGLYLSGKRVVLRYSVGTNTVWESPWIETAQGLSVFTRTFEIAAVNEPMLARVCDLPGGAAHATNIADVAMVTLTDKAGVTAVAVAGGGAVVEPGGKSAAQLRIEIQQQGVRFKTLIWRGQAADLPKFAALAKASPAPGALQPLTTGGPARWTQPVVTRGQVDRRKGPFAIDTLTVPYQNPWRALMFTSGHDFFPDGDVAVCTAHGDVWRVSGVNAKLEKLTWKRFATGLYQPLGLKILNGRVHVICRDQITILHDLNGDNEADYYENFNNDCWAAGGGHSYATCLETDPQGNFYFLKCAEETPYGGTIMRVSADGSKLDVLATGFRNPNGLGVSPDGQTITVADQQGNWVPETRLDVITPGGFYGFMPMHKRAAPPATYDPPLCWIPRVLDNSAGGETWAPPGVWGPFGGQMVHLSYGRCALMAILRDERNPRAQGAVVALPGRFLSGIMRARFSPQDNHLYVTGLRGWQTGAVTDGCLQRMRYTGEPVYFPIGFALHPNGVKITFSLPLDRKTAGDVENYGLEQWNYHWSETYGSPDFSVANPGREGRDPVPLKSARVLEDGRSVFLEVPDLRPVMSMGIRYNLDATDGQLLRGTLYLTINQVRP